MLYDSEKLGRPPVMRPLVKTETEHDRSDDSWKGEHHLKIENPMRNGYVVSVNPPKHKRETLERRKKVGELAQAGLTGREIADRLKISHSLVRQDASMVGVSLQLASVRK